LAVTR